MDDEAADNLWVRNRRQTKVGYGVCACCRLPDKVGETFFRQLGVVTFAGSGPHEGLEQPEYF